MATRNDWRGASMSSKNRADRDFRAVCAHLGLESEHPADALAELSRRMEESSTGLSIMMAFMRAQDVSVYRLSQDSKLSVSAVKNRLSNEDVKEQLRTILSDSPNKHYALVDLSKLSDDALAEAKAAQIKNEA